jgi:hypothetical protein
MPSIKNANIKKRSQELLLEDEEYVRRAIAAWFRGGGPGQSMPANTSSVVEYDGKFYVELHNVNGILAVYRIRNDGILKRLKRWPLELETGVEAIKKLNKRNQKGLGR